MSEFKNMTDEEILAHVENFGSDNERELIKRFNPDTFQQSTEELYDDCPYCEEKRDRIEKAMDILS